MRCILGAECCFRSAGGRRAQGTAETASRRRISDVRTAAEGAGCRGIPAAGLLSGTGSETGPDRPGRPGCGGSAASGTIRGGVVCRSCDGAALCGDAGRSDAREIFFGSMSRRFAKFVRKGRLRARRARRSESGNPEAAREDGVRPGSRMRRRSEGAVSTFGSRGRSGRRLRPGGRSSVGRMRQGASGAGRAVRAADRKADGRKEDAGCG